MMLESIIDAMVDAAKMAPLLFAIYAGIEFFEYKYGGKVTDKVKKVGAWGPLVGALAGIIPQCGFSVIATALYTQRLVTLGTLMAIYLSTSDEALPIMLSQPASAYLVLPLILTKLVIALGFGYALDFFLRKSNKKIFDHAAAYAAGTDDARHHHDSVAEEPACCGHHAGSASKKFDPAEIFLHPLVHTAKITLYIFIASVAIALAFDAVGSTAIRQILTTNALLGPVLAALVGLIPNCAASVAIVTLYLDNVITYGAAIAGLSASAGLGILVLINEEKNKATATAIIATLFAISVLSGVAIQLFG
jgi:hypothetical protein